MNYEDLEKIFHHSETICAPLEYYNRKIELLNSIAEYLLIKDEPKDDFRKRNQTENNKL